jgi:hypothetical protein
LGSLSSWRVGSGGAQLHASTRVVCKIRFPRSCSREERCYAGSGDTGVQLGSPSPSPHPGELSATLSLGLGVVRDGAPTRFSRQVRITLCDSFFFCAKNTAPVDIHSQLCEVYGEKCMSVQHVGKWCREFKDGRTDVHDEQRSGRPSVS